jgi:hypothetical protein
MPHYYDDDWADRRAEEKYYEYLYSDCHCYQFGTDPDDPQEGDELCHLCAWEQEKSLPPQKEEEKWIQVATFHEPHPWADQITSIKAQLDAVEKAMGIGEKLPAVRILLTNLLSQEAFLAVQPKFRAALLKKVVELRANPLAEPLTELFDQVDTMLEGVKGRDDYSP